MFVDVFEVEVEGQTFPLFQGFVTFYSGFFGASLKCGTFIEGETRCVRLPMESAADFGKFVAFMTLREHYHTDRGDFGDLFKLAVLSDKYMAPLLGNIAVDLILQKNATENLVDINHILYIYENTCEGSPIRRLCAATMALAWGPIVAFQTRNYISIWPKEALWDIMLAVEKYDKVIKENTGAKGVIDFKGCLTALNPCEFHTHKDGEGCTKGETRIRIKTGLRGAQSLMQSMTEKA